jgi:hypothetical protein
MFCSKNFLKVVSTIGLEVNNSIRCPDQWVGDVRLSLDGFHYIGSESKNFTFRVDLQKVPKKVMSERLLIIVLESPHILEYEKKSEKIFKPIGPANGLTGFSIRKFLHFATREIANEIKFYDEIFHLYLINAIPYQCSLGYPIKGRRVQDRNLVFKNCWEDAKEDFLERLRKYTNDKTIIINACTKGVKSTGDDFSLRGLVDRSINLQDLPIDNYYKRHHPASFFHWKSGRGW